MNRSTHRSIIRRISALLILGALIFVCFFGALPAEAKEKTEYGSSYSEVVNTPAGIDKVFCAFPESSRDQLKELLKNHSNWKFQAFYTSLDWEELFDWSFKLYDTNGESEMYYGRNLLEGISTMKYNSDKDVYVHPSSWYSTESHQHYNNDYTAIEFTPAFNWAHNSWVVISSPNWIQASEEAVRYCVDPRNFLDEIQIFQFEDVLLSNSGVKPSEKEVEAVFKNVKGSDFWVKSAEETGIVSTLPQSAGRKMTYAQAIYAIGYEIGVNPVFLASRIVQEQGTGLTDDGKSVRALISGNAEFTITYGSDKDKRARGYYNYFNMEATDGAENNYQIIINNGLTEAYYAGWNTPFNALLGGARKLTANYISSGQSTYYFQKFNVNPGYEPLADSTDPLYKEKTNNKRCLWGQYMGSLTTPQHEAAKAYAGYISGGDQTILNASRLFVIPVYENMPEKPEPEPTKDGNPNYKLNSIYISYNEVNEDGSNSTTKAESVQDFNADTFKYSWKVANKDFETTLYIDPYAKDTSEIEVNGKKIWPVEDKTVTQIRYTYPIQIGDNEVNVKCIAENGDEKVYQLNIFRYGEIVYGDINSDSKFNSLDLAYMTSHLLGKNILTGNSLKAADISGDDNVNSLDLAYLTSYLLGKIKELPR